MNDDNIPLRIKAIAAVPSRENPIKDCMEENMELVEKARDNSGKGLFSRILRRSASRLSLEAEQNELRAGFHYRSRALQLAVESKLQAVEEACNHVLVTGKSEIRRERQEFFADQVSRLSITMHQYAEEFNLEVDRRLQEIDATYKSPVIREKEEARLCRQIEDFHDMLETMAVEFQHIIKEGVRKDLPDSLGKKNHES